ncbi:hypothetical protein Drorol1_Dr00014598 [Drosera rotundifolia]
MQLATNHSLFIPTIYPLSPISSYRRNPKLRSRPFKISKRLIHKHYALTLQYPRIICKSRKGTDEDDAVSRILRENPTQVVPKVKLGDEIYWGVDQKRGRSFESRAVEILRRLGFGGKRGTTRPRSSEVYEGNEVEGGESEVHFKDIVRQYRGKLYVPEEMFRENLSEEEEFEESYDALPKMSFEELANFMRNKKVKLLVAKRQSADDVRDFIVELNESPSPMAQTKWAIRLDADQAQTMLEEYSGRLYEIETRTMSLTGRLPEYPNPVASSISSKMMIELGIITAVIAAAAVIVGAYLGTVLLVVMGSVFILSVFLVWPVANSVFTILSGVVHSAAGAAWQNLMDIFGGVLSQISEWSILTQISAFFSAADLFSNLWGNLMGLLLVVGVYVTLVVVFRYALARRSKNMRHWNIWQAIEFSQSKAEARVDGSTGVTFADVAGIEEAVEELQELVKYLKNPELFDELGIKPPHGVLLAGPPGCGKTLVAKAIAGEAGVPFYQMAGSEFVELLVGVGASRVRDLFKRAKVNKPSVVFIDEIDALGSRRQKMSGGSSKEVYTAATQERETTLNQLLIELDGFDTGKGVIFLGATNRMDLLDPALLRPGRFDRKIRVQPPNAKGRLEILKVHARKFNILPSVDLSLTANSLPGWTGAMLAQLMQEAALIAARKNHEFVLRSDIDEAVDRQTVGPVISDLQLGHQGQCRRATTEVGAAITSHLLRRLEGASVEPCDLVSINPRPKSSSQVVFHRLDDELYRYEKLPQLLHRLQVFLGGRAAEDVIYGGNTSTASVNYLADANWLARKIITIWNLENPMALHGKPQKWRRKFRFVGPRHDFEGSLYNHYNYIQPPISPNMEGLVEVRIEELLLDSYQKTVALLRRHHAALLKTIKVLLNKKQIRGTDIDYILDCYPPQTDVSELLQEENPESLPPFQEVEPQV